MKKYKILFACLIIAITILALVGFTNAVTRIFPSDIKSGNNGQYLMTSGTSTVWATSTGGTISINRVSSSTFLFDVGINGSDFNIATTSTGTVVFNIPDSSTTTRGLISTALYQLFNAKADNTINLTAGSGLYGGGDLSANRTFHVGAATGIDIQSDTVGLVIPVATSSGGTGTTTGPSYNGQLLIARGGIWGPGGLVAGSNITITTSTAGQISIASTASGGSTYWNALPTASTTDSYTLTFADSGCAGNYQEIASRGTILKWTGTTTRMAMVATSSCASNVVTLNLIGDTLVASSTMANLKYATEKARTISFSYPGVITTSTDIMQRYWVPYPIKLFGADAFHASAGTTNNTVYDINKNGTTAFTTKPTIVSGSTSVLAQTADADSYATTTDYISIDCDSVSDTPPSDATINMFVFPLKNQYLN